MDRPRRIVLANDAARSTALGCCLSTNAAMAQKAGVFEALVYDLRAVLRIAEGRQEMPTAAIFDSRRMQSTPESGGRSGYDGAKRRKYTDYLQGKPDVRYSLFAQEQHRRKKVLVT
jgi:hypothetical protein